MKNEIDIYLPISISEEAAQSRSPTLFEYLTQNNVVTHIIPWSGMLDDLP